MSPDGRRIAYARPNGTWLMNAHTGRPIRRLWRRTAWSIDWAPDGRRLVLTAPGRGDLNNWADAYVVRADGTDLRRLISTPKVSEVSAVWSPDGRRIAFVRRVTRRSKIVQAIWTMRSNGTGQRRIRGPWTQHDEEGHGQPRISWQPRLQR